MKSEDSLSFYGFPSSELHVGSGWICKKRIKKFHWSDLQHFYNYAIESILILNGWKASCDDKIKHFLNSQKSIILRFGFAFRYSSGTFRPFFGTFWPLYYQLIDHSAQIHQTKLNFGKMSTYTTRSRPDPDFYFPVRISRHQWKTTTYFANLDEFWVPFK